MVLFLAFIASILLAGFSLYDNGTVATERIRMQNTADATAYSTATVLARDMNFIAYTNRGMVANQVAIAQVVGMNSWIHMIHHLSENLDYIGSLVSWVPVIGQIIKNITRAVKKVAKSVKKVFDSGSGPFVKGTDWIIGILSGAQIAFQIATADMATATYREVAQANDKDIKTDVINSLLSYTSMITSWKEEVSYNEKASSKGGSKAKLQLKNYRDFAAIVNGSRDRFSSQRSYAWFDFMGVPRVETFGIFKKGGTDFHEIKKKGSGRELQWEWTAMDNVSLRHEHWKSRKWKLPKWQDDELIPFAGGAAHALYENRNGNKKRFPYKKYKKKKQLTYIEDGIHKKNKEKKGQRRWGYAWRNGMAAGWAEYRDKKNNLNNIGGLRKFYSKKQDNKRDIGPSVTAFLSKPSKAVRVQQSIDEADSNYNRSDRMKIEQHGGLIKDQLFGLSSAETYFARPKDLWLRKDGLREYGNLYNPFWQPRLVEISNSDRFLAYGSVVL